MKFIKKNLVHLLGSILALAGSCASLSSQQSALESSGEKHVRFLHMADSHAQLDEHWEYLPEDAEHLHRMGGFARIKTALNELQKSANGAVYTVEGGDTFQGSAMGAWTKGEAIVAPLNALGFDVGVPGNWEVVYGSDAFKKLLGEVNYKVITYNMHDAKTGKRLYDPAVVLERNGVKVAFVGVTDTTTTTRQPPAEVEGLDSTRIEGLREYVQQFKKEQKPDLTVLVDHTGLAISVQLAHDIPEFDIVLSGHTHERTYKSILVGKTIVVEPGSMGSFLGQLDVTLKNGHIVDHKFELVGVDAKRFPEDPKMKALVAATEKPYRARLDQVVAESKSTLMRYDVLEGTMDNMIADAVREAARTDIAFANGFRFSPPVASGRITQADLWNMLPLDTRIKTGKVSGKQLREYLERELELVFAKDPMVLSGGWGPRPSGLHMTFKAKAPVGHRIERIQINGKELVPDQLYSMGGCEREGEPVPMICRFSGIQEAKALPITVHQAVDAYVRKHSPIRYVKERRVSATDLPTTVWSQYGMLQKMWALPGGDDAVKVSR